MKRMRIVVLLCVAAGIAGAWAGWLHVRKARAQAPSGLIDVSALYTKQDVMIPMRDGVKLHTEIYAPKNSAEKLPFLIRARRMERMTMKRATAGFLIFIRR